MGNVIQTTDRNGREIAYTYDKLNRNIEEIWLDENDNPIRTFDFTYRYLNKNQAQTKPKLAL